MTYIKNRNRKSLKKGKKYKTLTTTLKLFDTFAIIAITSSSITLSLTEVGLKAIPVSTATAWLLSISNEVIYGIIIKKYNKYKKKQNENYHQLLNLSLNFTEKVYKLMLLLKVRMNLYVINLLRIVMKRKMNLFYKYEQKKV